MLSIFKNFRKDKKALRDFALLFSFIFFALAGYLYFKGNSIFQVFSYISIVLLILGFTFPMILKPLYFSWMIFGGVLGWFMTRLILIVMYYTLLTPISILARLSGKDFLALKNYKKTKSYWNKKTDTLVEENYLRQF